MALEKATLNLWHQARTVARTSNRGICRLLETQAGGAGQHHGKNGLRSGPPTIRAASSGMESMWDSYSSDVSISPGIIQESRWMTGVFELTPHRMDPSKDNFSSIPSQSQCQSERTKAVPRRQKQMMPNSRDPRR